VSEFAQLLDEIRRFYLDRFATVLRELEQQPGVRVVLEPPLLNAAGNVVADGPLDLAMRKDIVLLEHDQVKQSVACETESMLGFEPVRLRWNDRVDVDIEPFQWNNVRLALRPARPLTALAPIKRWFDTWFEEPESPRDPPFFGVVHFMSDPDLTERSTAFWVDFGSAPTHAVADLLDACTEASADSVFLGTTLPEEQEGARSTPSHGSGGSGGAGH
jgi:hypothetical protein